ncbi:MAG: hypothetical protein WCF66_05000 [Pseudolabrys sp.]
MTKQVEQKPDGLKAAADRVLDTFYMPKNKVLKSLKKSFKEECEDLPAPLKGAVDAFVSNIESAMHSASVPHSLTHAHTVQRIFDRFHMAERIRALKKVSADGELTVELEREAYVTASAKMREFEKSVEGIAEIRNAVVSSLAELSEVEHLLGAQELLSNTIVMICGAFEAFVSDALTVFLNLTPKLASALLSDDKTKKRFSGRFSIEAVESCGFDVSGSMGNLLLGEHGIGSLSDIKDVFRALFPTHSDLHATMKKDGLWLLWQRRHLLVHKRGLVDAAYLKQTGDKQPVGERLRISASHLEEIFGLVSDAGVQFVRALKSAS